MKRNTSKTQIHVCLDLMGDGRRLPDFTFDQRTRFISVLYVVYTISMS